MKEIECYLWIFQSIIQTENKNKKEQQNKKCKREEESLQQMNCNHLNNGCKKIKRVVGHNVVVNYKVEQLPG